MHRFKIISACIFACIFCLFGNNEKIIINKLDLIGNHNVSLNEMYNYNGHRYNSKHGFHYNLYSATDCYRFTKRMEKFCYKNGIIEKLLNRSNQNIKLECRNLENYNPKILKI